MKKSLLAIVLTLLGAFAFAQEKIAVFPFEDMDNILTKNESVFFYRQFSNEFTNKNAGKFTIVPRQDVEKLFNAEEKFQLSDLSAKAKTAETQRVLNGTQILSGVIGKVGNRITISVSLYTFPELSQLPGGVDLRVANKDELFDKIPELVQSMQDRISGKSTNTANNFVHVEGGIFQTISGKNVFLKSFSIGKYEVTQKEWYEVMGTTVRQQRDMALSSFLNGEGDNYPMYYVNWYEVLEYCNKRSLKEGLTPVYSGSSDNITCNWNANGYRLPTEAEWEFAAKGGIKDYLTTKYAGSNSIDAVAWYFGNSGNSTHPVGMKAPNSLGIYDMSGNVWEMYWPGDYSSSTRESGKGIFVRGASFNDPSDYGLLSQGATVEDTRSFNIGFRLVRNAN